MKLTLAKKRLLYALLSLAVFLLLMTVISILIGPYITDLVENPDRFRALVGGNIVGSILLFLGIQILQMLFAFIPGEPIELMAGVLYGAFGGLLICLLGSLIATALIFALTRRFGTKFTAIVDAEDKMNSLKFMQNEERVALILFLLMFLPGTPKDLLTYFAGLTKLSFRRFLLLSTVARIPSVLSSTIAGERLIEQDYRTFFLVFGITAAVSAVGLLVYRRYLRQKAKADEKESS